MTAGQHEEVVFWAAGGWIDLSTFADNKRAVRCYEKCGFVVEGVLRQYYWTKNGYRDAILMGLLREDWAAQEDATPCYIAADPA